MTTVLSDSNNFVLWILQLRQSELWERDKRYENKDEIMIITTVCGKACTLDTCTIQRSGTEVQGSSQFATVFLNYQVKN